jgi:tRNA (guanine-N7-)-methyltransferase
VTATTTPDGHDPVRTYKPRRGRLGTASAEALQRLRPTYGVDVDGRLLDPAAVFGRRAPLVLEIGCGHGEATALLAAADPARDVLAVDVHTPGLGALLRRVEAAGLRNVRVADGDAVVVLRDMLAPGSLDEVRVLFPDPWPKARHHKRRLVTPAFAELVADRLRPGGRLHVATDWTHYADQVVQVVRDCRGLDGGPVPRPSSRPLTRFERRAHVAGRTVVDVVATRV